METCKFLSNIFLFNSFAEKELKLLESFTSLKKVIKGEQIFSEGTDASAFFAVVSGKVKIYKVSPDGKEHTLHIHGSGDLIAEAALKMMSSYSKRLRQFVLKIEELSLKDIKSRLAGYLLKNSKVENNKTVCRLKYSKKELSSLLGTIPDTLSRSFAFLKQKGLIVEEDNLILIPDPDKLKFYLK